MMLITARVPLVKPEAKNREEESFRSFKHTSQLQLHLHPHARSLSKSAFFLCVRVAMIIGSARARTHARTRLAGLEEAGRGKAGWTWERVSSIRGRARSAVHAARERAAGEEDEDDEDAGDERSCRATHTPQSGAGSLVNVGAASQSCLRARADVRLFKKVWKRRCPEVGGWGGSSRWDLS